MSQLISMRQRIKTVETIKKITSAMRLVSRSFHTRLDKQKKPLRDYRDTLCDLLSSIQSLQPAWHNKRFSPETTDNAKTLYIIVGSQKGLCGTFNASIMYWIDKHRSELTTSQATTIVVGKKINDYLAKRAIPVAYNFPEVKSSNLSLITQEIASLFLQSTEYYNHVYIIGNRAKNFFSHELHVRTLLPFIGCATANTVPQSFNYRWEHDPVMVCDLLAEQIITLSIRTALFESLHAEQSARFISMDNATRNANNFLDSMKLQYNKARQAKITKELTELAAAK